MVLRNILNRCLNIYSYLYMTYVVRSRGSYCESFKGWRYWRMQSRHQGQAHYRKRQGMTGKQRRCGKWHTLEVNVTSLADLYMFYDHSWTWTLDNESFGKQVTVLKHIKIGWGCNYFRRMSYSALLPHWPSHFLDWACLCCLAASLSISIPWPSNNSIPLLASYMGVHIRIQSYIY